MVNQKNYSSGLISPIILVLIIVVVAIIGIYIVVKNQKKASPFIPTGITQQKYEKKCQLYGFNDKKNFLPEYTVKAGDTLLSIANKELGSVSRVNEIIELNKDRYPSLSIENPFIEQNWTLFLPPPYLTSTNGKLLEFDGELSEIRNDGNWVIKDLDSTVTLRPDKNVKMIGKTSFEVGDCVRVLYQPGAQIPDLTVFSVTSQN